MTNSLRQLKDKSKDFRYSKKIMRKPIMSLSLKTSIRIGHGFEKLKNQTTTSRSNVTAINGLNYPNEKWDKSKSINPTTNESIPSIIFQKRIEKLLYS